jgi:hypothetical protein
MANKFLGKFFLIASLFLGFFISLPVRAMCPLCTITVGVGMGLSRWLGIDDLISGIWVGGLMVSVILWSLNWLNKKSVRFIFRGALVSVAWYAVAIAPLYFTSIIGHPLNKFLGIDRLIFGIIVGSLVFWFAVYLHESFKKKNNGKSFFPYQKVVIPVASLIMSSLILYLIILI